ncbi:hypothetical protein BVC80_8321g2 [Macleaya cordata]|uniref:Uncharacterized protein n=1 Tax=Macleaya cordata TaxID=56857 RepID=A0A200PYU6_MACCD|nr:hypothetical protein BVC80_8321g2 [Macleaya cordata]
MASFSSESGRLDPFLHSQTQMMLKRTLKTSFERSEEILKANLEKKQAFGDRYFDSKRSSPGGPDPQHHAKNLS